MKASQESQDGEECSSNSDSFDASKVFNPWLDLKDGHKLER